MLIGMSPQRKQATRTGSPADSDLRCTALTSGGQPCQRRTVPGLTVCKSHGGGTAASVRVGNKTRVSQRAAVLWGISSDAGSISVEEELHKLARNKLTDISALRIKISTDAINRHIGTLTDGIVITEYDIEGTVQSKSGSQEARTRKAGVSPWVQELHKAEQELVQILRLLQEVTGGSDEVDVKRIRIQTAREAARLLKAFPGISVDDIAAEVSKRA